MRLEFENNKVQKYFDDYNLMIKTLGPDKTRTVKKHIDRLKASTTFQGFVHLGLGKPHLLHENLAGNYGISVSGNLRLIVKPDCENYDTESLKNCNVVIVKGVCDYHGGKIEWFIP